jgi:hypothetical protein
MIARAAMVMLFAQVTRYFARCCSDPYDGVWNVTVVTKIGSCQPTANYPLLVTDGKVSGAADISGSVGRNGVVRASLRGAFANGQLGDHDGSGKWNAASAGMPCSGQWIARRQ